MQLISTAKHKRTPKSNKGAKEISLALAAATCSLLGSSTQAAAGDPGTWRFDTAILYYGEDNSRVQAVEPVVSATRYFDNEKSLNFKLVLDTLTGASPSGATPSDQIQSFTRPSGNGSYTTAPGDDPLDDTFRDTRTALSAGWSSPINRDWSYNAAVYGSSEHDYQSFGLSGTLSRYLNQKNTQLNFGLSFSADTINPEGGLPVGLSRHALQEMSDFDVQFANSRDGDSDTKSIADLTLGFSQVISKRTIMQFNYSFSNATGYLTDPYKILSVINDEQGADYGHNAVDDNGLQAYIYEQRPDKRTKHALFWQLKTMLDRGDVIDGSYRFMTDDWGIQSHTLELKYRWQFDRSYLQPHLRYYTQGEADFYRRFVNASEYDRQFSGLEAASADYRLGQLDTMTLGLKYGRKVRDHSEFTVRAEYYIQTSDGEGGFGALANQDLYLDTNAVMFSLGYSF